MIKAKKVSVVIAIFILMLLIGLQIWFYVNNDMSGRFDTNTSEQICGLGRVLGDIGSRSEARPAFPFLSPHHRLDTGYSSD